MRLVVTCGLFLLLSGCATPGGQLFNEVREGMDKDTVLHTAGNPKYTFRSNGQDHWVYTFFEKDQEFSRQVDFLDGKVTKIGKPIAKQGFMKELEAAESMEAFEKKTREQQRKSKNFKEVPGGQ
jgi:outer membrane protein assembly factor BamE (lipoprotein component of BamABCDE complex)